MAETTATTAATATATKKTVTLRSSDGEEFKVAEAVALQSQTIKPMIEDECAKNGIPVPNVDGKTLAKVIEYCNKHATTTANGGDKAAEEVSSYTSSSSVSSGDLEMKEWDAEFLKVDQNTLFDLILAANYLDIKSLLDLTCKTVADMMRGKKPEEIREIFNIKNDYTPEEEAEVRKENAWAFD